MENNNDLKIMGSGDASGGSYNNVSISGSGDIHGDVECNSYVVKGSGDINGNLKANFVKISGSGDINGDVNAEEIIIRGSGDVKGSATCKNLRIAGSSDVDGDVYAEEVELKGSCDIGGNCETETFLGRGAFDIKGLLNAGDVEIELKGNCNINEIGAGRISIRKDSGSAFGIFKSFSSVRDCYLKCKVIEGDEIYLENTKADVVRGKSIIIGPNCEIKNIEYIDNLNVDNDAKVQKQLKLTSSDDIKLLNEKKHYK